MQTIAAQNSSSAAESEKLAATTETVDEKKAREGLVSAADKKARKGVHNEHAYAVEDGLHEIEFPNRLRLLTAGNDLRVEPNQPRTYLLADEAVQRITDKLAMELAARLAVLDRMADLARLHRTDGDQVQAYGRESRAANVALLLGDEAVHHDPLIHPLLKAEVRDRVRTLLWAQTTGAESKPHHQNPWVNN